MKQSTQQEVEVWLEAVVTRADGTVEDLGVIAVGYAPRWYQRVLRRLGWRR